MGNWGDNLGTPKQHHCSDAYTCAIYAKKHDLLNTLGWKVLKRHATTARRFLRTLKKSKYRQAKASRKYKHGWKVPRAHNKLGIWLNSVSMEFIPTLRISIIATEILLCCREEEEL